MLRAGLNPAPVRGPIKRMRENRVNPTSSPRPHALLNWVDAIRAEVVNTKVPAASKTSPRAGSMPRESMVDPSSVFPKLRDEKAIFRVSPARRPPRI